MRVKPGYISTRQEPGRSVAARQEELSSCNITGYETRIRTECEEVEETQCERNNVTKHRQEIVAKCQTLVDQQCNVTYVDVPTQQCQERPRNRCETLYKVVEDRQYREECIHSVQVPNTTEPTASAPEGCRSLEVKECKKFPIFVSRKVPYTVGFGLSSITSSFCNCYLI